MKKYILRLGIEINPITSLQLFSLVFFLWLQSQQTHMVLVFDTQAAWYWFLDVLAQPLAVVAFFFDDKDYLCICCYFKYRSLNWNNTCAFLIMLYFSTSLTLGFCIIKSPIGVNERAIKQEAQLAGPDNANSVPSKSFYFYSDQTPKRKLLLIHLSTLPFVMLQTIYV